MIRMFVFLVFWGSGKDKAPSFVFGFCFVLQNGNAWIGMDALQVLFMIPCLVDFDCKTVDVIGSMGIRWDWAFIGSGYLVFIWNVPNFEFCRKNQRVKEESSTSNLAGRFRGTVVSEMRPFWPFGLVLSLSETDVLWRRWAQFSFSSVDEKVEPGWIAQCNPEGCNPAAACGYPWFSLPSLPNNDRIHCKC